MDSDELALSLLAVSFTLVEKNKNKKQLADIFSACMFSCILTAKHA